MENVNKYPISDDNPPSYDVAVGYNNQVGVAGQPHPTIATPQNPNISQSTQQQFQYYHHYQQTPITTSPYPQIPQNYQVVTVLPSQPCLLTSEAAATPRNEIPRNIRIISYIGICVCVFVVIMTIRSQL